jgi:hypothetical protein
MMGRLRNGPAVEKEKEGGEVGRGVGEGGCAATGWDGKGLVFFLFFQILFNTNF